jgi:hypothetical protein
VTRLFDSVMEAMDAELPAEAALSRAEPRVRA